MQSRWPAVCLTLSLGIVSSGLAQYTDGGGSPGGMRHRHGMMGEGHGGMKPLDPVVADGPPAPADFAKVTGVADTTRYARLYDNFMASTRAQRDSLTAARQAMRTVFEDRDRHAARGQASVLKSIGDDLSQRQQAFDDAVKDMVTKDEWKKYQAWRDDQRKTAEDRRRGDR